MPRGALKSSLLLVGTLGMTEVPEEAAPAPAVLAAREAPPEAGMTAAVERFSQAWRAGDAPGMLASFHPERVRHVLGANPPPVREALQRLAGIQSLLGHAVSDTSRPLALQLLDVRGRSASVRAELGPWSVFLHLSSHRGGWKLAHILWEWQR